jgi:hypothetical protein
MLALVADGLDPPLLFTPGPRPGRRQLLAEQLAAAGVTVLLADVKVTCPG